MFFFRWWPLVIPRRRHQISQIHFWRSQKCRQAMVTVHQIALVQTRIITRCNSSRNLLHNNDNFSYMNNCKCYMLTDHGFVEWTWRTFSQCELVFCLLFNRMGKCRQILGGLIDCKEVYCDCLSLFCAYRVTSSKFKQWNGILLKSCIMVSMIMLNEGRF